MSVYIWMWNRVHETLRETNSTSSKCLCKRRRLSKYQTGYGQVRYLMKRLNTVLSNKLQESKPSRFYSVRQTEKLQQEQKKGRLTNPSHRPKEQRFLQKKRKDDDIQEPSWNVAQKQKQNWDGSQAFTEWLKLCRGGSEKCGTQYIRRWHSYMDVSLH